ncbi:MAG: sugar kinase [Actinobacteria bacterium]|nr:sugar kinase [Actinomycetota bacterium]
MSVTDLYTFGEVMALFVASDTDSVLTGKKYELQVVGAEANVAVALARLGLRAQLMSRVGQDQLGQVVIAELAAEGVDISRISRVAAPTGTMVRNRGTTQPVEISYLRTASAATTICPSDVNPLDIHNTRWVHLTGISAAISSSSCESVLTAMNLARAGGVKLSFDLNIRRQLWSEDAARDALRGLVRNVDVLFGGSDEYAIVWQGSTPSENLIRAAGAGVRTAIMTSGAGVIRVLDEGNYWEYQPPVIVVVDPVGSGDAFVGGVISALLSGLVLKEAIVQGSLSGAAVAEQIGDWAGLPRGVGGRRS